MNCWFCESPLCSGPEGGFYCPFSPCPACKAEAAAPLDGPEPERWRRMREGGTLARNLAEAGLTPLAEGGGQFT